MGQVETDGVEPTGKQLFDNKRLMTKREVADFFSVSTRTIDRWVRAGKVPKVKVGGDARFEPHEVAKLLGREEDIHAKSVS